MDMSFWQSSIKVHVNEPIRSEENPYDRTYYEWLRDASNKIPNLTRFFDCKTFYKNPVSGYFAWYPTPKFGMHDTERVPTFMLCGGHDVNSPAIAGMYGLNHNNEYDPDSYISIDYAKIANTYMYGFRGYGDNDYTSTERPPRIVTYTIGGTFDNTSAYIGIMSSPIPSTNGIHNNNGEISHNAYRGTIITSNSDTPISLLKNEDEDQGLIDKFMNPNYGKTDNYILTNLAVQGTWADGLFSIDGGLDFLSDWTIYNLSGSKFVLNKHIAITNS